MPHFPNTSLLVTHYNRSSSLERLLSRFQQLGFQFAEIVVSDDGSKPEHAEKLKSFETKYGIRLVTTPRNKGLANNLNKGQAAVKTPYTLYVQEDFDPQPLFAEKLEQALELMEARPEIDVTRFYAYFKYPYLKPLKNGFSEMRFKVWYPGYRKFYYYSDHPHLRRSNFNEKFGNYREGIKSDKAEYEMMINFLKRGGRGLYYDEYTTLFDQRNSAEEPSTVKRQQWRTTENPLIAFVRAGYRGVKFTFDYFF